MKQQTETSYQKDRRFLFVICLFGIAYYLRYFKHTMTKYNTTLFAMSYKYGFISRGLLGTMWEGLDRLLPIDLMTYEAVYWFNLGVTVAYYLLVVGFSAVCLRRVADRDRHNMYYMIIMLAIFMFPMFWSSEMFGRLDVYLYFLSFLGIFAILSDSWAVWLIVPIGIIAMCIHQGYVFTNANLLLVPLFYRILTTDGARRKRYLAVFLVHLVTISALFLYFEFFSHSNGAAIYEEVVEAAKALSKSGKGYNVSVLKHEILGEDVYKSEARYHKLNQTEFPAFLLMYSPYFLIALYFFRNLFRGKDAVRRWCYLAFLGGAVTILPQYLLKVDFGRYAFTTFVYYIIMTMMFMVMGDAGVSLQLEDTKRRIKEKLPVPWIVLVYPMFLTPFYDVVICGATSKLRTLVLEALEALG